MAEICIVCKEDCTAEHYTCKQSASVNDVICPTCFPQTDCGKGKHKEWCSTWVLQT